MLQVMNKVTSCATSAVALSFRFTNHKGDYDSYISSPFTFTVMIYPENS